MSRLHKNLGGIDINTEQNRIQQFTFDYIVIGSGPAGSVLSKKLTDDPNTSLLLLEAGDNNSREQPIRDSLFAPPFILTDDFFPNYFWQGKGIPQKHVAKRSFDWTGGRTLGGSSSVNNEQYVRPSQKNMQSWENKLGPLWSPTRETFYFKQLEKYNGVTYNPSARGFDGRLTIRQTPADPTHMTEKLVSAIENVTGYERILDYNDPLTPLGPFTRWQLYQDPYGTRMSADTAFLSKDIMTYEGEGVGNRKLKALYNSTALRVLFDHEMRAIGVEFLHEGKCMQAYANKKVILSAGINSPKILMHSGIGPSEILKKARIPLLYANENVGKNLTTHSVNTASFKTNPNDKPLPKNDPFALYTGGAFLPDPTPGADPNRRGVQIIGQGGPDGTLNVIFILLEPKSRGSLTLQNDDPLKMVLADEGFFNQSADLESLKNIYKNYLQKIAAELAKIDSNYRLLSPSLEIIQDDKKLEEYIQTNLQPTHHIQGTLRMAASPRDGVVDASGHVYGVKNLIVADDSIAPFPSDGNTSAPSFLIGANIADQLLGK